jgi:hypothetical protein
LVAEAADVADYRADADTEGARDRGIGLVGREESENIAA